MKRFLSMRRGPRSIRARVLTTVAVPSALLLILGIGATGYLVEQAYAAKNWATHVQAAIEPDIQFISQVAEERRLTSMRLSGGETDPAALAEVQLRLGRVRADVGVGRAREADGAGRARRRPRVGLWVSRDTRRRPVACAKRRRGRQRVRCVGGVGAALIERQKGGGGRSG